MFLLFKRYVPFKIFGVGTKGYSGNDRVSADIHGEAKTWGRVEIDTQSMKVGEVKAWSNETTQMNWDGTPGARATATPPIELKLDVYEGLAKRVIVHTGGKNPHTPAIATPDIDTFLDVKLFRDGDTIKISGSLYGDPFPNAEVFVESKSFKNNDLLGHFVTTGGDRTGVLKIFGVNRDMLAQFDKTYDVGWLNA